MSNKEKKPDLAGIKTGHTRPNLRTDFSRAHSRKQGGEKKQMRKERKKDARGVKVGGGILLSLCASTQIDSPRPGSVGGGDSRPLERARLLLTNKREW